MKKLFFILILFIIIPLCASAQTERDILLEIVKQQATNNAKIDAMQKQMDTRFDSMQKQMDTRFDAADKRFDDANKRVDILLYVMLGILGGLFGVIGFIVWDRQISMKPLLQENKDLAKEVKELKEEMQTNQTKTMNTLKKIIEIEPRFAGIL